MDKIEYKLDFPKTISMYRNGKKTRTWNFRKASLDDVRDARFKKEPAMILKNSGEYYIATFPEGTEIPQNIAPSAHMCACCHRCRPLPKLKGGCRKVEDAPLAVIYKAAYLRQDVEERDLINERKKLYIQSMKKCKRIEKYPFITCGIETINMHPTVFIVLECCNFKPDPIMKPEERSEQSSIRRKFYETAKDFLEPAMYRQ